MRVFTHDDNRTAPVYYGFSFLLRVRLDRNTTRTQNLRIVYGHKVRLGFTVRRFKSVTTAQWILKKRTRLNGTFLRNAEENQN